MEQDSPPVVYWYDAEALFEVQVDVVDLIDDSDDIPF